MQTVFMSRLLCLDFSFIMTFPRVLKWNSPWRLLYPDVSPSTGWTTSWPSSKARGATELMPMGKMTSKGWVIICLQSWLPFERHSTSTSFKWTVLAMFGQRIFPVILSIFPLSTGEPGTLFLPTGCCNQLLQASLKNRYGLLCLSRLSKLILSKLGFYQTNISSFQS